MAAKASFRNFFKPTPRNVARLGNALFMAATSVAIPAAYMEHRALALGVFIAGALGKFLTMFFGEDEPTPPPADPQ